MTAQGYWLCNTDETEEEGRGAYRKMLSRSCIAAWGSCNGQGAEKTLNKPQDGDTVYLFCAGQGIVAIGQATDKLAFRSNSIFGKEAGKAFMRRIVNLKRLQPPVSVAQIRDETGYELPYKHTVCRLLNRKAIKFIASHAKNNSETITLRVVLNRRGAGFGDTEKNSKVEKAAVRFVRKLFRKRGYEVKSREKECLGYDLDVRKGNEELHLEIKGVTGSIPEFPITPNEVLRSKSDKLFRLVVVTNALEKPNPELFTGDQFQTKYNLAPMVFMARRKS